MSEISSLVSELVEILRKKKQHLLAMLNFTQMQTSAIDEKDDDVLSELIDKKQALIQEIDILDKAFIDKFNVVKSKLGINSLEEISTEKSSELRPIRFELDGIYMLLEQIFSLEKENSVKLKAEHDDIKSEIRKINEGKNATSAYGGKPMSTGGAFFDTKK